MELTSENIRMFDKSVLLNNFHRYLRFWFISGKLDSSMTHDPDIKPYITPCSGHVTILQSTNSSYDQIDGVLVMEAYCPLCQTI